VHSSASSDTSPVLLSVSMTGSRFTHSRATLDVSFFDNAFSDASQGYAGGGAIFVRKFNFSIHDSSFTHNSARSNPIFFVKSGKLNPIFANGGALLLSGDEADVGRERLYVTLFLCNFSRNVASGVGAAFYSEVGSMLSLSRSLLTYNSALAGAVGSAGFLSVSSSEFANNTAVYVATDIFVGCVSRNCEFTVSSTTFTLLEATLAYYQLEDVGVWRGVLGKSYPCILSSLVVEGNGFAPTVKGYIDTKFIDNRDSATACRKGGFRDLFVAIAEYATGSGQSFTDFDTSCSVGQYPNEQNSITASLSRVSLTQSRTAIFQLPSFRSATETLSSLTNSFLCVSCPSDTFQGTKSSSLQEFKQEIDKLTVGTILSREQFFCKPCPSGGICRDPQSLNVTPGLYLWHINNGSRYNVSEEAVRLPAGYGDDESS
jgi:hypothetical protein